MQINILEGRAAYVVLKIHVSAIISYLSNAISHSYIFYEVANSYEFIRPHSYDFEDLSRPQWLGLGAGLGVGHLYKFIQIVQLVKYVRFSKNHMNLYKWGRTN